MPTYFRNPKHFDASGNFSAEGKNALIDLWKAGVKAYQAAKQLCVADSAVRYHYKKWTQQTPRYEPI